MADARYDHTFLVSVQTDSKVPAETLSRLIAAFEQAEIPAHVLLTGVLDFSNEPHDEEPTHGG